MEWLNVTVGFDIDIDWIQSREHILRSGYAWVGVSAQRAGVHASETGLRAWSPERYGTLDLTAESTLLEDELAYDVFAQAAAAVRRGSRSRLGDAKASANLCDELVESHRQGVSDEARQGDIGVCDQARDARHSPRSTDGGAKRDIKVLLHHDARQ